MRTLILGLVIAGVALLAACSDNQATDVLVDEKCGEATDWFALIEIPRFSNVENGKRTMIFDTVGEPEDLCSKEHAKPVFRALGRSLRKLPDDIKLTASTYIPLFTPRKQEMTFDEGKSEYGAAIEIGLDQAYKDKPGYIAMQITAEFPSRGDYSTDSAYLADHLHFVTILLKYKKHKP
jgi:hypothetical protein